MITPSIKYESSTLVCGYFDEYKYNYDIVLVVSTLYLCLALHNLQYL